MGTNYYWHKNNACPTCHHEDEPKHIGKSSSGWHFTLNVYPEDEINTMEDWHNLYSSSGFIKDEYGDLVTPENMLLLMTARSRPEPVKESQFFDWKSNDAQPGYNNLVQQKISRFCIGHHPKYPVDYCIGDFS